MIFANALDTVHEQVNFLARPQLSNEDVIMHWSDSALWEKISLVPQGDPCHMPGIHFVVHIQFVGVRGIFSSMGVPSASDLETKL